MPKKYYKMTTKRILADLMQANWEKRIKILELRNQGWTQEQIAAHFGMTYQAVQNAIKTMGELTVTEAEHIYKLVLALSNN